MSARALVAAAVAAAALALTVPVAGAQEVGAIDEVGWWTRRPGASEQPAGGFEVAAGVGMDQSVAALRVGLAGPATSARLLLEESGGFASDTAALRVCTTSDPWAAANPGAWDDAPEASCDAAVPLERGDDGTWSAEVTALVTSSGSLLVMPDPDGGEIPVTPGFQITFAAATLDATGPPPPTATSTVPGGGSQGSFGGGSGSSGFEPSGPPPSFPNPATGAAGGFAAPATGEPEVAAPAGGAADAPQQAPASDPLAAGPIDTSGDGDGKPWGRLFLLVPLSAAAGAAVAFARQFAARRGISLGA